ANRQCQIDRSATVLLGRSRIGTLLEHFDAVASFPQLTGEERAGESGADDREVRLVRHVHRLAALVGRFWPQTDECSIESEQVVEAIVKGHWGDTNNVRGAEITDDSVTPQVGEEFLRALVHA